MLYLYGPNYIVINFSENNLLFYVFAFLSTVSIIIIILLSEFPIIRANVVEVNPDNRLSLTQTAADADRQ